MTMAVAKILFFLMVMAVEVTAQAPSPAVSSPSPPIICSLPNTSMVSSNWCNSDEEKSLETQTASCNAFLMDEEPAPSDDCCKGLNQVAYNRTACICSYTFYPPSTRNATRQLDLPRLCGVITNLCGQCPQYLVTRSNGTAASPVASISTTPTYSEGKSMASTIGAISLAVVCGLLLLGGIIGLAVSLVKKRRAKLNPPGPFEAAPPGGVF